MRNAARLLEVHSVGGVETLAVAGYHRADIESLASSTSSGAALPAGFRIESRTGSPRQLQLMDLANDNSNGNKTAAGSPEGLHHITPPTAVDETGLMECRIRRLEVGRRRAERTRRVASSRRVARVAKEQRKMLLTCDAEALASSKSSFEALLLVTQGTAQESPKGGSPPTAAGLEKAHVLALRDRVVLECLGGDSNGHPQRRRGSVEVIVEAVRRGSVQLRRGSVQLVAGVRERTLKRPVSSAGSGDRNDDSRPPLHADDAGDTDGAEETNQEEKKDKEDGVVLLALDTEDDAGALAVSNSRGAPTLTTKQDEARGEHDDTLRKNADGVGTIECNSLAQRPETPGKVTGKEGTPTEKQQPKQQQKRRRPVTRFPRKEGLKEGAETSSTLEGLLSAVAGLTQKVEEGGLMGATAYAAWWLGAVSAAELELKKLFLTPGPSGSLQWGKGLP